MDQTFANLNNSPGTLTVGILSPVSGATVTEGRSLSFLGSVTDGTPPYTVTWNFGNAAAPSDQLEPGNVTLTAIGVDDPDGTMASPYAPFFSVTSTWIVGLPRESMISIASSARKLAASEA